MFPSMSLEKNGILAKKWVKKDATTLISQIHVQSYN